MVSCSVCILKCGSYSDPLGVIGDYRGMLSENALVRLADSSRRLMSCLNYSGMFWSCLSMCLQKYVKDIFLLT